MSILELVTKGFLVGISVSAPIGPIGILCINRSIRSGLSAGLATGLGAVVPNILYTLLAALGFVQFIKPLLAENPWLIAFSGVYVCYLGIKSITCKNDINKHKDSDRSDIKYAFLSTFLIMVSNPATLIGYTIIFSAIGLGDIQGNSVYYIAVITTGIVCGAFGWWIFLSGISVKLGRKIFKNKITKLNRISGIVIIVFGTILIIKSLI